eukprot:12897399-Prorocentrum_lima.AAC.1
MLESRQQEVLLQQGSVHGLRSNSMSPRSSRVSIVVLVVLLGSPMEPDHDLQDQGPPHHGKDQDWHAAAPS